MTMSLDGYVARSDGSTDWGCAEGDHGLEAFYDEVAALIMGRLKWEQVTRDGRWPYSGKAGYVFSRTVRDAAGEVRFVGESPSVALPGLQRRHPGTLWLLGGAGLITQFADQDLIDEYLVFHIPTLLGAGLTPFASGLAERPLRLVETRTFETGVVRSRYRPVRPQTFPRCGAACGREMLVR